MKKRPPESDSARAAFQKAQDEIVREFLSVEWEGVQLGQVASTAFHRAFVEWMLPRSPLYIPSCKSFALSLARIGVPKMRTRTGSVYIGLQPLKIGAVAPRSPVFCSACNRYLP